MKNYAFLFWAYNVIWIGLAAYVLFVFRRIVGVERRLENLNDELERRGRLGDGAGPGGSD